MPHVTPAPAVGFPLPRAGNAGEVTSHQSSDHEAGQAAATGGPGQASAGVPAGAAPSGAVEPGTTPEDQRDDTAPTAGGPQSGEQDVRVTPGQGPGPSVPPVPAPGAAPGVSAPAVMTAQAASPRDGVHAGEKKEGSDASVSSPGQWSSLAAPGKPDGEVDTRAR